MTIESDIKRIADSLELIASHLVTTGEVPATPKEAPPKKAPPAPKEAPPAPKEAPPAPKEAPPAPKEEPPAPKEVPPAPGPREVVNISVDELNAGLVKHYERLGCNREPIDKVMVDQFGVDSINRLDPSKYGELLQAVSEIRDE